MAIREFNTPSFQIAANVLQASPDVAATRAVNRGLLMTLVDTHGQWDTRSGFVKMWGFQIDRLDGSGFV